MARVAKETKPANVAPETVPEPTVPEPTVIVDVSRKPASSSSLTLTNATSVRRGITLDAGVAGKSNVIYLEPGETRAFSGKEGDAVKLLLASKTGQRLVDGGIFKVSGKLKDEELITQETPKPPADLSTTVSVGDTTLSAGLSTEPTMAGTVTIGDGPPEAA